MPYQNWYTALYQLKSRENYKINTYTKITRTINQFNKNSYNKKSYNLIKIPIIKNKGIFLQYQNIWRRVSIFLFQIAALLGTISAMAVSVRRHWSRKWIPIRSLSAYANCSAVKLLPFGRNQRDIFPSATSWYRLTLRTSFWPGSPHRRWWEIFFRET